MSKFTIGQTVHHMKVDYGRNLPSFGRVVHLGEMKGQSEDSEEIDIVERRLVIRKNKKLKYRCSCNACVETAPVQRS